MANSEALVDCGFVADGFFEGGQDDRYHPFRPLKELNPNQFDVILLADDDEARETSLDRVLTTRDDLAASNCRIILLRRLFSAHYRALNRLKVGRAFSCLNIRKLCIVASCVYVTPNHGCVIEVGCYRGGTTIYVAMLQQLLGCRRRIYACDTFAGMPAATSPDLGGEFVYTSGQFTDNPQKLVVRNFAAHRVADQITICPGLVQDTLPKLLHDEPSVAFAIADTDQYAGTKAALDCLLPRFDSRSMLLIDDTTVSGVQKAIQETLSQHPEFTHAELSRNFDIILATKRA